MELDSGSRAHNNLLALQNAFELTTFGYWLGDADGSFSCDSQSCQLLGVTAPQAPKNLTDFLSLIKESQQEAVLDALHEAQAKNQAFSVEFSLDKAQSAEYRKLRFTGRAYHPIGSGQQALSGVIEAINTVSSEATDVALAEARNSNAELANFASVASHDMREPLRMITSYLKLLQERAPEALDERAQRYISYACDGADRMRSLIEDLLSYARLDQKKRVHEPLALEDILADSIDNLRLRIKDTQAEVTIEIDHAPVVSGDRVRLTRLFQNLISNGIKFHPKAATPKVHISFRDGERVGKGAIWIVCIEDQGIGMNPEHHDLLFQLFQRLNTRDEFDGSGIGLAVCKKIAEQHGGQIWFESKPQKGSTFYVGLKKACPTTL